MRPLQRRSRTGATTVEFVFVALPLFLLVYGAVTYGSIIMSQNVVSAAAADGCRIASVRGKSASEVFSAVDSRLALGGVKSDAVRVKLNPSDPAGATRGQVITVHVSIPATDATWLNSGLFPMGFDVSAEVTQIKE